MAKTKISEFSSTPSDNTDIDSINIAEGCAPSGINNAIRELMAQLKDQQTGAVGDSFVVGGGFTCTGAAIFSSTVTHNGAVTNDSTVTNSSTVTNNGAVTSNAAVTNNAATVISVTDNTNAALRITQLGTGNALLVEDSANPDATPFVIDASGNVLSGYTTSVVNAGSAVAPRIQLNGSGGGGATAAVTSWAAGINVGGTLLLSRSEGSTVGTQTIVDSGDQIGKLSFAGSDGTAFIETARIEAVVDGTPGTNDMPGRLVFSTTADGAAATTERVRIGSAGQIGIAGANYGTSGQVLTSGGSAAAPAWSAVPGSMTLLGTLTTTSGTTQVLSGLTLTGYKSLHIVCDNVSFTGTTGLLLGGETVSGTKSSAGNGEVGIITVSLNNGVYIADLDDIAPTVNGNKGTNPYCGRNGITNASTSITFSGGTFDAGTILVYGVN